MSENNVKPLSEEDGAKITARVHAQMNHIANWVARRIERIAGMKIGLAIVVFTPGKSLFVSNVQVEEVLPHLRALVAHYDDPSNPAPPPV